MSVLYSSVCLVCGVSPLIVPWLGVLAASLLCLLRQCGVLCAVSVPSAASVCCVGVHVCCVLCCVCAVCAVCTVSVLCLCVCVPRLSSFSLSVSVLFWSELSMCAVGLRGVYRVL